MANLWLLQTSDMLSIASGQVAGHFTHRGLVKALNFEMDAEGCIGVCWRDEPYIDNTVVDFRQCLLKAAGKRKLAGLLGQADHLVKSRSGSLPALFCSA
ncbi:hypothetical protein [Pseudomonas sp. B28(2017)]|uniref:hypothetical protein n=1 Tax=Pseudomonas sp. B28(2017) TaxID=1981730 RepID=UPI002114420C|nr:hypothetical protein [Pseudomonas sp. B28(2017)]